ncbi:MAG: hypothetical protein D6740_04250 [Alphaproteobacteria bacterium]|nr:MAG: hypothetical protein D6740_04250 [Alphaproteobacteria bacterium]
MTHPFTALDMIAGEEQTLAAWPRLGRYLGRVSWFSALGEPLAPATVSLARDYLAALGLPEGDVTLTESPHDAADVLTDIEAAAPLRAQEDQLRQDLLTGATARMADPERLFDAVEIIKGLAAVTAGRAIEEDGVFPPGTDPQLLDAAVGAAVAATVDAALLLTGERGPAHPFALRFRLFERGRWPLALIGASFHLY